MASEVPHFDDVVRDIICRYALGHEAGRNNSSWPEFVAVKEFQVQLAAFGLDAVQRGVGRVTKVGGHGLQPAESIAQT